MQTASSGKRYLCTEVLDLLVDGPRSAGTSAHAVDLPLGARERRVLQLVAQGMSSPQISQDLQISRSAVDPHRRNLMRKLGVRGVAELTRYAIRFRLISAES